MEPWRARDILPVYIPELAVVGLTHWQAKQVLRQHFVSYSRLGVGQL